MRKITGNEPIYPTPIAGGDNSVVSLNTAANVGDVYHGLTIRQQFAMAAMQARIIADAILSAHDDSPIATSETLALLAGMDSDALINELNK